MRKHKLYNPSSVAAALASSDGFSSDARRASARAMLRYNQHQGNYFDTRTKGGLHPLYTEIHGRSGQASVEHHEISTLIKDTMNDTFDSVCLSIDE